MTSSAQAMISAHRSGAELDRAAENRRPTLLRAAEAGFEFVEFDVQRCLDGTFVLHHDHCVTIDKAKQPISTITYDQLTEASGEILTLPQALQILRGRTKAHVDFKFVSPAALYQDPASTYEVEATMLVIDALGVENCIITTAEDASVLAVRRWSRLTHPSLLVGLSLGRRPSRMSPLATLKLRSSEIFAQPRLLAADANLVVAHRWYARLSLADLAQRMGLPLLVWTVDSETELRRWLSDPRAWLVTSNFPHRAAAIREDIDSKENPVETLQI